MKELHPFRRHNLWLVTLGVCLLCLETVAVLRAGFLLRVRVECTLLRLRGVPITIKVYRCLVLATMLGWETGVVVLAMHCWA